MQKNVRIKGKKNTKKRCLDFCELCALKKMTWYQEKTERVVKWHPLHLFLWLLYLFLKNCFHFLSFLLFLPFSFLFNPSLSLLQMLTNAVSWAGHAHAQESIFSVLTWLAVSCANVRLDTRKSVGQKSVKVSKQNRQKCYLHLLLSNMYELVCSLNS